MIKGSTNVEAEPYHVVYSLKGALPPGIGAQCRRYRFLAPLVRHLSAQLSSHDEAKGRSYQQSIIKDGCFTVPSPIQGDPIASGDSIILPDRTIFYRFPACAELLVGAANLGKGYPLCAVMLRDARLLVQIGERAWGIKVEHVAAVDAQLSAAHWWPMQQASAVRVLTGDPNFAHHAWNQLPALEMLMSIHRTWAGSLAVAATFQPLGPLHELLPNMFTESVATVPASIPVELNCPGNVHVNAGGFLLTRSVRDRIFELAKRRNERLQSIIEHTAQRHRPIIWLSVRTRNRTARNQSEFLQALARRLMSRYENCAIILDGHTLPDDLDSNSNYDVAQWQACVDSDQTMIDSIVSVLASSGAVGRNNTLVSACGLGMLESVLWANAADYYVCHHGTVQHKVGWLAGKPGIVHSNERTLKRDPAKWVSDQCEGAPVTKYFPRRLVRDVESETSDDDELASRLFENYEITDVEGAVEFVLTDLVRRRPADTPALALRQWLSRQIAALAGRAGATRPG